MGVVEMEVILWDSSLSSAQPTFLVNDLCTFILHFPLDSRARPLPLARDDLSRHPFLSPSPKF